MQNTVLYAESDSKTIKIQTRINNKLSTFRIFELKS